MSLLRIFVLSGLTAFALSGCLSTFSGQGDGTAAAQTPSSSGSSSAPVSSRRAGQAAVGAMGGKVVSSSGEDLLCSLVDRYPLCGDRPCRKDGLRATTYYICRVGRCAGTETLASGTAKFKSHNACMSACRKAESDFRRAKGKQDEKVYCMQ